jgi:hypothetical protein
MKYILSSMKYIVFYEIYIIFYEIYIIFYEIYIIFYDIYYISMRTMNYLDAYNGLYYIDYIGNVFNLAHHM